MRDILAEMSGNFAKLSPEERYEMGRAMRGENREDQLRREDVNEAIRELRLSKLSLRSSAYQAALRDVQLAVAHLPYRASQVQS